MQTVRLNLEHSFRCFTLLADRVARCQHCRRKGQREAVTGAQLSSAKLSSVMCIFHFSMPPNAGYLTVSRASTCMDERGRWGSDSTLLCLLCRLLTMEVPLPTLPTRVHCLIAIRINATCLRWTRSLAGRMTRQGEYRSQCLNWSHIEASSGSI